MSDDSKKRDNQTDEELKYLREQLVQSEKMAALGHLVAGVAHEINTPLGALKSNNDLAIRCFAKIKAILMDAGTPPQVRENPELVKFIDSLEGLDGVNKTALERIVSIVQSLRNFARLDETNPVEVDLHEELEATLTLVHHKLKNRITVERDFAELPAIQGFPHRLAQVFMNILVNACQAIEDKGEICIKTFREADDAVIEIRDSGKGIPKENLPRIFEPGFTTKEAEIGTGLGLSIVYQIIEEHDGTIRVDSEVGRGTTVRIELPIR